MFKRKIDYDVQMIINEVASRHKLFLKPDDAAFALITMNRLVFDESLDTAVGIIDSTSKPGNVRATAFAPQRTKQSRAKSGLPVKKFAVR